MKFGFCSGFQWLHGPSVSDFISDLEHSTIFTISKRLGLMWSCNLFITLSNGKYFTFWSWCSIISESSSVRFSQYALLGALRNISICSVYGLKVHTTDYALQGCQCNQLGCAAILFCSTFDIVLTNNDDAWNKDSSIIPFDVNKWIIIYEVPMLLEYWKKTATIHLCPLWYYHSTVSYPPGKMIPAHLASFYNSVPPVPVLLLWICCYFGLITFFL